MAFFPGKNRLYFLFFVAGRTGQSWV